MYGGGNIAITVSDEEPDAIAGKYRVRGRRRRRSSLGAAGGGGGGSDSELFRWIQRKVIRWWMFLFFVPALIVLVLESSRMERKIPITVVNVKKDNKMNVEVVHGNLNRLDPTTRIVAGMRRRKILVFNFYFCLTSLGVKVEFRSRWIFFGN